jgi:hypothetical protein
MNRRDAKIAALEKEAADYRGRPDPYADVIARGRRVYPGDSEDEHRAIINEKGVGKYLKIIEDAEKARDEKRAPAGKSGDDETPAWAKAMQNEWREFQDGQKKAAATYKDIDECNVALDKQDIKDADLREAIWKRAAGLRMFAERHGDRKPSWDEAVADIVESRMKRETTLKEAWAKELEEKSKSQQASLPKAGASAEPPGSKSELEAAKPDSEEKEFLGEFSKQFKKSS